MTTRLVCVLAVCLVPCVVALRRVPTNSSVSLARVGDEHRPLAALHVELQARAQETGSSEDPHLGALNGRLRAFAEAIHFAAQQKRTSHHVQKANSKSKAKDGEEVEYSEGHAFEEVAADKTCAAGGKIGKYTKKVKAAEDCFAPCAEMPGCVAFTFYQKPSKMCELFSKCGAQEDANVIRKAYLYALKKDGEIMGAGSCGKLPEYPYSKPAKWNEVTKGMATKAVAYTSGDIVKYVCNHEYSTDGSKEGATEFGVSCNENNVYVPDHFGCIGASECGAVPCVRKTHATGKVEGDFKNPKIELVCDDGYSLDGEKVVVGGDLKNARLYLECDHSGQWSPPLDYLGKKGKACEPFAFVPASGMIKMYNKVFEVLFVASCNTELTKWAEMKEALPPKLEDGTVCGENVADEKEGDCKGLVDDLKTLFEDAKGEGHGFDAKGFCKDMWDLLKMDEPAAKTTC